MKYCRHCGKKVFPSSNYCGSCGGELKSFEEKQKSNSAKITSSSGGEKIGIFQSYKRTLKKYFDFHGRASRREYWVFVLLSWGIYFVLAFLNGFLGVSNTSDPVLPMIFYLFVLIPTISVGVRRMRDVGNSGWFLIVPVVNLIMLLIPGNDWENKYGEKPSY